MSQAMLATGGEHPAPRRRVEASVRNSERRPFQTTTQNDAKPLSVFVRRSLRTPSRRLNGQTLGPVHRLGGSGDLVTLEWL